MSVSIRQNIHRSEIVSDHSNIHVLNIFVHLVVFFIGNCLKFSSFLSQIFQNFYSQYLQWCWWLWWWLRQFKDVVGRIIIFSTFLEWWCPMVQNQSLTSHQQTISNIHHQHQCNPKCCNYLSLQVVPFRPCPFAFECHCRHEKVFFLSKVNLEEQKLSITRSQTFRVSESDFKTVFENCSWDQRDNFTRDNLDSPLTMVYMSRQMMNILCFIMDLIIWGWEMKTLSHINLLAPSLMLLMSH